MLNLFDTGADIVTRTGRALQAAHKEFFSPTDHTEIPSHSGLQKGGGKRKYKRKHTKKNKRSNKKKHEVGFNKSDKLNNSDEIDILLSFLYYPVDKKTMKTHKIKTLSKKQIITSCKSLAFIKLLNSSVLDLDFGDIERKLWWVNEQTKTIAMPDIELLFTKKSVYKVIVDDKFLKYTTFPPDAKYAVDVHIKAHIRTINQTKFIKNIIKKDKFYDNKKIKFVSPHPCLYFDSLIYNIIHSAQSSEGFLNDMSGQHTQFSFFKFTLPNKYSNGIEADDITNKFPTPSREEQLLIIKPQPTFNNPMWT